MNPHDYELTHAEWPENERIKHEGDLVLTGCVLCVPEPLTEDDARVASGALSPPETER